MILWDCTFAFVLGSVRAGIVCVGRLSGVWVVWDVCARVLCVFVFRQVDCWCWYVCVCVYVCAGVGAGGTERYHGQGIKRRRRAGGQECRDHDCAHLGKFGRPSKHTSVSRGGRRLPLPLLRSLLVLLRSLLMLLLPLPLLQLLLPQQLLLMLLLLLLPLLSPPEGDETASAAP